MLIIIEVKNISDKKQQINLLGSISNNTKLPKYIEVSVSIKKDKIIKTSYLDLIRQLEHKPCCVIIKNTTNNRQINFYTYTMQSLMYGVKYDGKPYLPIEPSLTKNKEKRFSRYSKKNDCFLYYPKWDSKKWNIADTKELFILDNKILFELNIKPKQKFKITIEVEKLILVKINQFDKISDSIYVIDDISKYLSSHKLKK